jgi:hypothetical protein
MFTTLLPATAKVEDLFDAWDAAAQDARLSWDAWRASAGRERGDARACYAACLDREERGAGAGHRAAQPSSSRPRIPIPGSGVTRAT